MLLRSGRAVHGVGLASPAKADGTKQGKRRRVRATECNTQATASIFSLSRELLHLIICNLAEADAIAVSNTCKQLAHLCNGSEEDASNDHFWKLYCKRRGLPAKPLTILRPTIRALLHNKINNTCSWNRHPAGHSHNEVQFNTCPDGVRRRICWMCYDELLEQMVPARNLECTELDTDSETDSSECDCDACFDHPDWTDPDDYDKDRREKVLRKALALEHLEMQDHSSRCYDYIRGYTLDIPNEESDDEDDGCEDLYLVDVVRRM